jgi:serine protease
MKQLVLFALMIGLAANAALAERTTPRPPPIGDEGAARVIVKFRSSAALLRTHALSATANGAVRGLDERAAVLGARLGLRLRAGPALTGRVQVVQADGVDARTLAARLAQDADVEYAEVDRRMRRVLVPNDARFASVAATGSSGGPAVGQWYLRAPNGDVASSIDAVSAWDTSTGSASLVVAVLDTGVRTDHPDLAGKLLPGYDMVDDVGIANDGNGRDSDASDPGDWLTQAEIDADALAHPNPLDRTFEGCEASPSSWHGTQVSGIVGAATNNGAGMAGAGWNVRVLPVRVLGKCFGYTSDIVDGIRWAAGLVVPGLPINPNPARVINLSLGSSGACSISEREAIADVNAAGVVVVVAAGNTAGLAANSPANCPGAIGVAALRHVGTKVGFSDVGPELSIAAPGGNCVNLTGACLYPILTTIDSGTTVPRLSTYSDSFNASVGTSFSSPLVAATAALMLSVQPALTPAGVRAALQASARPFPSSGVVGDPTIVACQAPTTTEQLECYCTTSTCGAGMLDTGAAVRAATGIRVVIGVSPAAPIAGQAVTLSGGGSTVAPGRSIAGWQWSIADAGTTGSTLVDATAATATLQPTAAGTATVRLVVTDDLGVAVALQQGVVVAAAPVPPPAASGGGGVMSWLWLLALALATVILTHSRWRRRWPMQRSSPRSADNSAQ